MSGHNDPFIEGLSRRTFVQATGAAAGLGLLGTSAASHVDGDGTTDSRFLEFTNPRVQAAANAWERGYRGRADRTLALTDTGVDSQHPAVGMWNGVVMETREDFQTWRHDYPSTETVPITDGDGEAVTEEFSGFASYPGTTHELTVPTGTERITLELLERSPEALIEVELNDSEHEEIAAIRDEVGRVVKYDFVDDAEAYDILVESLTDPGTYAIEVAYHEFVGDPPSKVPVDDPMDGIGPDDLPGVVGWNNDSPRYVYSRSPRDLDSHGTHVTGIMTGSGQASAIDPERSEIDEPMAVLLPGEVQSYEVEAEAETGVFGAAYGQGIEIVIEGPGGRQLRRSRGTRNTSEESMLNNTAETPTVHESGEATYTVHVRATEGEALPARIESVAVGAFKHHADTPGDTAADGDLAMHSGVAPGYSVLGITNLGTGTNEVIGAYPGEIARNFNVRACNMSWGLVGGLPSGTLAGFAPLFGGDETLASIREMANNGILTVASAGNTASPASGNNPPAVANEVVSTVATGPLDGIASYSDGGIGGVDDESQQPYPKPDVTAIGGVLVDLDQSAMPGDQSTDAPHNEAERFGTARTFSGKGGTSMASPSVCGAAGLVAQAMEEDAPSALQLPTPAELADMPDDEARAWTLRVKQALLATANTTAFNAAPFHRGKAPTYSFEGRDPYEGFGRMNVGAAIDAVSRDLLDGADSLTSVVSESVGLNVPLDEQAVAGYVRGAGDAEVSVSFSHYGGGNAGMPKGAPHVDLFVYDGTNPEGVSDGAVDGTATGDPNVVASAQGFGGEASVSFVADPDRVYFVVAKLVAVPGVVNGFDVQAHLDLEVAVEAPPVPAFSASGDRELDIQVVSGRQATRVQLTVSDMDDDAEIQDRFPEEWRFLEAFSDGTVVDDGVVSFGTVDADAVADDDVVTVTYFVESPDGLDQSGHYAFGPAVAEHVGDGEFRTDSDEFAGQDDALVVGADV